MWFMLLAFNVSMKMFSSLTFVWEGKFLFFNAGNGGYDADGKKKVWIQTELLVHGRWDEKQNVAWYKDVMATLLIWQYFFLCMSFPPRFKVSCAFKVTAYISPVVENERVQLHLCKSCKLCIVCAFSEGGAWKSVVSKIIVGEAVVHLNLNFRSIAHQLLHKQKTLETLSKRVPLHYD